MPTTDRPDPLSLTDLPAGWGTGKVVSAEALESSVGAEHVGFDPVGTGLLATEVQSALVELALGVSPTAFVPLYTVDSTIVDTDQTAAAKTYSEIKLAVAAGESAGYTMIAIMLVANYGVLYPWVGADSGFVALSEMSVSITMPGGAALLSGLDMSGIFPDAAPGIFPALTFEQILVTQSADITLGNYRQFNLTNRSFWSGNHHVVNVNNVDAYINESTVTFTRFVAPIGGYAGWNLRNAQCRNNGAGDPGAMFQRVAYIAWDTGVYRNTGAGAGFSTPDVGLTATTYVTGVDVDISDPGNVGAYAVFDAGAAGAFTARGCTFCLDGATSAVTMHNATATVTAPEGVLRFPVVDALDTAVPLTGVAILVPTSTRLRYVCGDVTLTPAAGIAKWTIEVQDSAGVYKTVQVPTAQTTDPAGSVRQFGFFVPGGRNYRFTKGGGGGTTETITHYSTVDS